MRVQTPTKAWLGQRTREERDIPRQKLALLRLSEKKTSHKEAERIWREAKRNANYADVVTSWAGIVS